MAEPDINEAVRQEMRRFRQALPGLLDQYAGRWVVFKDGQVQSDHGSSAEAHKAGQKAFGVFGGQVIVRVAPEEPRPISAGAFFGL